MQIDFSQMRLSAIGLQQSINQPLQSIGFGNNDFGIFALLTIVELGFQKLRGASNAAERIFHFVGQIAQERTRNLPHASFLFLANTVHRLLYGHNFKQYAAFALGNAREHDLYRFGFSQRPA